jgi:O-antigen ligase
MQVAARTVSWARADPIAGPVRRVDVVSLALGLAVVALPMVTPFGPANITPADPALLAAIVVVVFAAGTAGHEVHLPYLVPAGIVVVAGALAAVLGSYPKEGFVAVVQDMFLFAWCAAIANAARSPNTMASVLRVWSFSGIAWASILVGAVMTGQNQIAGVTELDGTRAALTFGEQNGAALYFVVTLVIVLAARCPSNRALRTLAVAVIVTATLLTGSLAGLSGILGIGLTVAFLGVQERRGLTAAVGVFTLMAVASGFLVAWADPARILSSAHESPYPIIRDSIGRQQDSSGTREVLAREAMRLYRSGPALGRGPVTTKEALLAEQAPYAKEAHNDYLAALVERGAIGLAGVLLFAGALVVRASAVWTRRRLSAGFAVAVPYPAALVGGLVAIAVFSFTHEVLHDRSVWAFFALIAALHLWGRAGASGEPRRGLP